MERKHLSRPAVAIPAEKVGAVLAQSVIRLFLHTRQIPANPLVLNVQIDEDPAGTSAIKHKTKSVKNRRHGLTLK